MSPYIIIYVDRTINTIGSDNTGSDSILTQVTDSSGR